MFKRLSLSIMAFIVLFSLGFSSSISSANAATEEDSEVKVLDVETVTNLETIMDKYSLNKSQITSSYSLTDNEGIINLYNKDTDTYYNFYVNHNEITYQSIQKELEDGNVSFDLYTNKFESVFKEELTPEGEMVADSDKSSDSDFTIMSSKPNKAALKWACIFSSYIACIGVAAGVGAAGTLISGPFGAAAGFAGGAACRYVFQTLVEKYGSKGTACKILS
ncbi:hypothetical protein ACWGPZ_30015 [Priestia megaterium]